MGTIEIGLFGKTVPKTVENFAALATHEKVSRYRMWNVVALIRGTWFDR